MMRCIHDLSPRTLSLGRSFLDSLSLYIPADQSTIIPASIILLYPSCFSRFTCFLNAADAWVTRDDHDDHLIFMPTPLPWLLRTVHTSAYHISYELRREAR